MAIQEIFYMSLLLLRFYETPCLCLTTNNINDIANDKVEKQYPNGTVIGKYSYQDKEGNPIHVKYYADKDGYGVELKSVKIEGPQNIMVPALQNMEEDYAMPEVNVTVGNEYLPNYKRYSKLFKYVFHGNNKFIPNTIADFTEDNSKYYPKNKIEVRRKNKDNFRQF